MRKTDRCRLPFKPWRVFKSVHGTLNHLLVTDKIWWSRLTGETCEFQRLDHEAHAQFSKLERARRTWDEEFVDLLETMTPEMLAAEVQYRTLSNPDRVTTSDRSQILAHLFNHQTHHRGHVHGLLSQTSVAPPPLDLIMYFRGR